MYNYGNFLKFVYMYNMYVCVCVCVYTHTHTHTHFVCLVINLDYYFAELKFY